METISIVIAALLAVIGILLYRVTLILRKVHEEMKLNTTIVQFLNKRFENRSSENMNTLRHREKMEEKLEWISGSLHKTAEATENLVKIEQKLSAIEKIITQRAIEEKLKLRESNLKDAEESLRMLSLAAELSELNKKHHKSL